MRGDAPRANATKTIVGKSGRTICERRKRQRKGLDNTRAAWKAEAIGGEYSSGKISQDLAGRSIPEFVGNGRLAFNVQPLLMYEKLLTVALRKSTHQFSLFDNFSFQSHFHFHRCS